MALISVVFCGAQSVEKQIITLDCYTKIACVWFYFLRFANNSYTGSVLRRGANSLNVFIHTHTLNYNSMELKNR